MVLLLGSLSYLVDEFYRWLEILESKVFLRLYPLRSTLGSYSTDLVPPHLKGAVLVSHRKAVASSMVCYPFFLHLTGSGLLNFQEPFFLPSE